MAIPTRVHLTFFALLFSAALVAETPAKKTTTGAAAPGTRGTTAASATGGDSQAPLQNGKSKKKKLLRPGVEWEPAPAPLKW